MSGRRNIPSSNKGKQGISSSNPPTNPRSRESLRRTEGWEPNPFGDFPPNPMTSSMYTSGRPGYDATRRTKFPDDSRMGREYHEYKGHSAKAIQASTEYNKERRALGSHTNKISTEGHRQLHGQSEKTIGHRKDEANFRDAFLHEHVGRRDHDFFGGHKKQVADQTRAVNNMNQKMKEHQKALRR